MKTFKMTTLFLLFSMTVIGQNIEYRTALQKFQEHYNMQDAQKAFDMLAPSFQNSFPLSTFEQVFVRFDNQLGSMESFKFESAEGQAETYLAKFERGEQKIKLALNEEGKIMGLLFRPAEDVANVVPKFEKNSTPLQLPFKGEWFVVWGGDTKVQNYHVVDKGQRRAFDILKLGSNNKTYERSGTRNEDYFCFGKPLYAVCDAEVIDASDGVEDNKPGTMNSKQVLGNYVTLKTGNDEYIFYAHFENGTINVKKGDFVKKGQYLGNVGNSGNSSEAHLHIHMQAVSYTHLTLPTTPYV